ncbi:MAG: hypothetical protein SF053_07635 [Bacteroidia bacterium]|nr:hypothetical protein [Bacteroidia bacterium]
MPKASGSRLKASATTSVRLSRRLIMTAVAVAAAALALIAISQYGRSADGNDPPPHLPQVSKPAGGGGASQP